jgi:hypothetical protein
MDTHGALSYAPCHAQGPGRQPGPSRTLRTNRSLTEPCCAACALLLANHLENEYAGNGPGYIVANHMTKHDVVNGTPGHPPPLPPPTPGRRQGLTLVHFSAQLEPCLAQENTLRTLNTP